jgi:hypothetical protein
LSVFDKAFGIARRAKAFLKRARGDFARGDAASKAEEREERARNRKRARQLKSERKKRLRSEIKSKKQELSLIKKGLDAAEERATGIGRKRRKKSVQQEIFQLERELRAAKKGRTTSAPAARPAPHVAGEPVTGALPDFVVIGTMKGGTTSFYHLLTQHPYVEPAAAKELHFFNNHFDEGVEWYRRCFPAPRWKDGRRVITGEATPGYMRSRLAPERMARVIPQARLIALLRNPVDRSYSEYQQVVRKGRQIRTFPEAIGLKAAAKEAERTQSLGAEGEFSEHGEDYVSLDWSSPKYLSKSVYVDQLLRWAEFFPREQMLVLKSEDFFESPVESLKPVLAFLGLPDWEPEIPEFRGEGDKDEYERIKRNKGTYEEGMDPLTRRRLEEYFEPHNRRLYDFLGTDLGW